MKKNTCNRLRGLRNMMVICLVACSLLLASYSVSAQTCEVNGDADFANEIAAQATAKPRISLDEYLETHGGKEVHTLIPKESSGDASTQYLIFQTPYLKIMYDLPVIVQENGSYCGPATVLQNLKYISKGLFHKTQDEVALAIGAAYFDYNTNYIEPTGRGSSSKHMTPYMNNIISQRGYSPYLYDIIELSKIDLPEDDYINVLYSGIDYYDIPPFSSFHLDMHAGGSKAVNKWRYNTSGGHFMSYSGLSITNSGRSIRVTDPNYARRFPKESDAKSNYFIDVSVAMETMLSLIW